jgi:hypothetical protein
MRWKRQIGVAAIALAIGTQANAQVSGDALPTTPAASRDQTIIERPPAKAAAPNVLVLMLDDVRFAQLAVSAAPLPRREARCHRRNRRCRIRHRDSRSSGHNLGPQRPNDPALGCLIGGQMEANLA